MQQSATAPALSTGASLLPTAATKHSLPGICCSACNILWVTCLSLQRVGKNRGTRSTRDTSKSVGAGEVPIFRCSFHGSIAANAAGDLPLGSRYATRWERDRIVLPSPIQYNPPLVLSTCFAHALQALVPSCNSSSSRVHARWQQQSCSSCSRFQLHLHQVTAQSSHLLPAAAAATAA